MKLQITLTLTISILFLNNIYAKNNDTSACQVALQRGDVATALMHANKALADNKKDKDALICQGRGLGANDDFNGALSAFKQAEAQTVEAFDKAVIFMLMGNTYKALKQHESAITSYNQATIQAKASKTPAYERASYNAIGNIHALNQQYQVALAQYQLGSQLAANDNERGESFEKIALMHHKNNQHDLAVEFQLKGYAMQSKSGSLDEQAEAGILLGRYYVLTKNYSGAENILHKILRLAVDNGGAYYEAKASSALAQVKHAQGKKSEANTLIDKAKQIAKNLRDAGLEEEIKQETQDLI